MREGVIYIQGYNAEPAFKENDGRALHLEDLRLKLTAKHGGQQVSIQLGENEVLIDINTLRNALVDMNRYGLGLPVVPLKQKDTR
jgi:hypothetical protein